MAANISIPTFAYGTSKTLSMGGLVSGLDVQELINAKTSNRQAKLIQEYQKKQQLLWKQEQYQSITTKLRELQNNFFKFSGPAATNLKSTATFTSMKATASSDAVSVSADSGTASKGFTIKSVDALATGASISSGDGAAAGITASTKLSDLAGVDVSGGTISVGGVDVAVTADTTVGQLVNAINKNADSTVTASFSEFDGGFKLTTKKTGSAVGSGEVAYNDTTGALDALWGSNRSEKSGTDAKITLLRSDGTEAVRYSDTNTFKIDGVNITANKVTNEAIDVKVGKDVDKAVDAIKKFVEKYNSILTTLSTKINEKKNRDVLPLTDDQRREMADKEAEAWDENAKKGLLTNDSALSGIYSNFLQISSFKDPATGQTLGSFGIMQESWTASFTGKLEIDEDKLRASLENDPDSVASLFAGAGGLVDTLDAVVTSAVSSSPSKPGSLILAAGDPDVTDTSSNIYNELKARDEAIKMMKEKLEDEFDRERARYTALETMLNKLNASSSMFSQATQ